MTLSNGSIKTFEVSIEQFNQLRYGVAKLLHDMQTLRRHPIMKVVGELERRDCEDRCKLPLPPAPASVPASGAK